MHRDFGEWYRLASIEPNDEMLTKRWSGVEEWRKTTEGKVAPALDIVRLFIGRQPVGDALTWFVSCFTKHDKAFPQRNNEFELRVLAGAAIANCTMDEQNDGGRGMAVALAATCAASSALRPTTVLAEIVDLARDQLTAMSSRARTREGEGDGEPSGESAVTALLSQLSQAQPGDMQQLHAAMLSALRTIGDANQALSSSLGAVRRDLARTDEECNMLWWVEGKCSRSTKTPWRELPGEAIPLIAAKELADLTEILPGPPHAYALLHRVLCQANVDSVALADAIDAVPLSWLDRSLSPLFAPHVSDLTPVLLALKTRADHHGESAWRLVFETQSGIDASQVLKADDLAEQAYLESLLLKSLGKGE